MTTQQKEFPITGKEGDPITLKTAAQWTRNYRQTNPNETISHFFGNEILNQILSQQGNMGIRIYYSNSLRLNGWQRFVLAISNFLRKTIADAEGEKHLILAGVAIDGSDQLPDCHCEDNSPRTLMASSEEVGDQNFILGQQAMPCPGAPGCPKNVLTDS